MKSSYLFFFAVLILAQACTSEPANQPIVAETTPTADYYTEAHRPQFHFTPEAHWMNDPNGLVFYDGEYHLFYQYYPDSIVWGPMHWGHAVSADMVHWQHLPIALYPDSLGLIFSGSAVVDWNNASGFGVDGQPPMIAIFTHHNMAGEKAGGNQYQYQSIAYSNDKGRSWTKYAGNPVVPNPGIKDFRDPKVIWYEPTQNWVMVFSAYDKVRIYTSPNLKDWTFASEFGIPGDTRLWECPDLFPMKVAGKVETKWVLITSIQQQAPNGGTATSYFVGDFDGKIFKADYKKQHWLDYGTDNYAMVTWSDIPKADGRRLALGWMSNWQYAQVVPTTVWRSAMTLPRVLTLEEDGADYWIKSEPVKELEALRGAHYAFEKATEVKAPLSLSALLPGVEALGELKLQFAKEAGQDIKMVLSNAKGERLEFGYAAGANEYFIDRRQAGKVAFNEHFAGRHTAPCFATETIDLQVFIDRASIEIFADGGRTAMTDIFFFSEPPSSLTVEPSGEGPVISSGEMFQLRSTWGR